MDEHDRPASLQLLEQRREAAVAEIDTAGIAEEHDSVEPERVEGVGELSEDAVRVGQRKAGEAGESRSVVPDEIRGELVASPGESSCGAIVPHMNTGRADGGDG